jgi:hypothetical protein
MRFEVLTGVKMSVLVFWVVTPCGLASTYQRFGGTKCINTALKMEAICSSETYLATSPYGVTIQKANTV